MSVQTDNDFLRQEYFHLQNSVEDFDKRSLTIKSWSVTSSLAAIGFALKEERPVLLLVGSASALLFWVIEAIWKSYQQAHYPRIRAIEDFMRGGSSTELSSPSIMRSWSKSWRWNSFIPIMVWGGVCLPHIAVVIVGLLLWSHSKFTVLH
jgi:hypothetical protein